MKMADIFDNIVYCSKCKVRMHKTEALKEGFSMRALQCPKCNKKIYHAADIEEYKKFSELKKKAFKVKLRIVGNSYAVSIPKEIVDIFEKHGFIWGGRWSHYDTMHFEYRPEFQTCYQHY